MRTLGTDLLILSLLITAIPLRGQDSKSSNTGAVLLDKCGEVVKSGDSPSYKPDSSKAFWCMGYLEGIMNLMSVLRMVYSPTYTEFTSDKNIGAIDVCFPKGNGVSNDQVVRIVVKWLQDHPQDLHKGAESLVVSALHDSFPCRAIPAR